jgi:hypothetical protein
MRMKNLETRTDQDNAILGQNFSIFEKLEKFVSIFHTGPKFFKRVLKKFRRKIVRLSGGYRNPVPERQKEKSRIPHQHALLHTGAKFFYLQEARKIYSTLHTGANFSIFVRRKIGKIRKSHPKWAS